MVDYKIKCEVVKISNNASVCPGSSQAKIGEVFTLGGKTPGSMCARAYASIYPTAMAMRFSEEIPWEQGRGYFDITCPDCTWSTGSHGLKRSKIRLISISSNQRQPYPQPKIEKELAKLANPLKSLEAAPGFEPGNNGFADRRLPTWLRRPGAGNGT